MQNVFAPSVKRATYSTVNDLLESWILAPFPDAQITYQKEPDPDALKRIRAHVKWINFGQSGPDEQQETFMLTLQVWHEDMDQILYWADCIDQVFGSVNAANAEIKDIFDYTDEDKPASIGMAEVAYLDSAWTYDDQEDQNLHSIFRQISVSVTPDPLPDLSA